MEQAEKKHPQPTTGSAADRLGSFEFEVEGKVQGKTNKWLEQKQTGHKLRISLNGLIFDIFEK